MCQPRIYYPIQGFEAEAVLDAAWHMCEAAVKLGGINLGPRCVIRAALASMPPSAPDAAWQQHLRRARANPPRTALGLGNVIHDSIELAWGDHRTWKTHRAPALDAVQRIMERPGPADAPIIVFDSISDAPLREE